MAHATVRIMRELRKDKCKVILFDRGTAKITSEFANESELSLNLGSRWVTNSA